MTSELGRQHCHEAALVQGATTSWLTPSRLVRPAEATDCTAYGWPQMPLQFRR